MTSHIFIVDESTLKSHLEHLFAGTGALSDSVSLLHGSHALTPAGRRIASMVCDLSRISVGDAIFFYLQRGDDGQPGLFMGEFSAVSPAYAVTDGNLVNGTPLSKNLPLRIDIAARSVYSLGVPEDEFLDRLTAPDSGVPLASHEVPWSLIYRKLSANRGCVAIRDEEADLLRRCLRTRGGSVLVGPVFNLQARTIVQSSPVPTASPAVGPTVKLAFDLWPSYLLGKAMRRSKEVFLQWKIIFDLLSKSPAAQPILNGDQLLWLGNEVRCGVGNRAIDLLLEVSAGPAGSKRLIIIELKDDITRAKWDSQIYKYVEWAIDHYLVGCPFESIEPILVTTKTARRPKKAVGTAPASRRPNFSRGPISYDLKIRNLRCLRVDDSQVDTVDFLS